MRASRLLMCLAVALLGVVWTAPTASAQWPPCHEVSKLVKVGQSFDGAVCFPVTYTTVNGKVITSRGCTCHATICTFCWAPKSCDTTVTNAYCTPLLLIKSP